MYIIHQSVLVREVISGLNVSPGKWYIDATLGTGGHTREILDLGGRVIGIDQDQAAIDIAVSRIGQSPDFTAINANFDTLYQTVSNLSLKDPIAGILFDLGTSAIQLESPERGFSFQHDAPLDMRMSRDSAVTAADLVNALSKKEIAYLLKLYSQESYADRIAKAIVEARQNKPITSTKQLASIIMQIKKLNPKKIHPATKTFQALRMAVNDEMNVLKSALPQAEQLLSTSGRLAVISFHENEDRLVKQFLNTNPNFHVLSKKPITPSAEEIYQNPRARSAKLRIAEKIGITA